MKRRDEIGAEKEYLSGYIDKKYDLEENKQQLEEQIQEQEMNLKILQELKQVEAQYTLAQEKIKIGQRTIQEYEKQKAEINLHKNKSDSGLKPNQQMPSIAICAILILLSVISIFWIKQDVLTAIFIGGSILSIVYASYQQYKKKLGKQTRQKQENVEEQDLQAKRQVLQETIQEWEQMQRQEQEKMQQAYQSAKQAIRNTYMGVVPIKVIDTLLDTKQVDAQIEVEQNKIAENKLKIKSLALDRASILPKLENLVTLEEEEARLEEEYECLQFENDAIELAKEEMEKAYLQMKHKITPGFTRKLSNIMQHISNGKYTNIQLNEKDELLVETQNGAYIPIHFLSVGTIEQLYLSLRLGAENQMEKEQLPIILDEAFAYYDEERLGNILTFLQEEYAQRQIILLTCTNREESILQAKKIPYHKIEL